MSTLALGCTLNIVNLALVELRVVHLDNAVALRAVLGLDTFTVLEEDFLISDLFMPRPVVPSDIKVRFKRRLCTESEAKGALDCLYQCKGGNCNEC